MRFFHDPFRYTFQHYINLAWHQVSKKISLYSSLIRLLTNRKRKLTMDVRTRYDVAKGFRDISFCQFWPIKSDPENEIIITDQWYKVQLEIVNFLKTNLHSNFQSNFTLNLTNISLKTAFVITIYFALHQLQSVC